MIFLSNCQKPTVFNTIQGLFNGFKNRSYRYFTRFHFDGGNKINNLLQTWLQTIGISFNTSASYTYEQNGLIERSVHILIDRLRAMLQWAGLFYFLWYFIIQAVLELINCTAIMNRDLTPYQLFYDELEPATAPHRPNLKAYKAIGSHCKVLIPLKKQPKVYKVKAKIESGRLLTVLGSKTCLAYVLVRNVVTKTPFIKLYKPKNPLTLKGVIKPIGIRPLNDVAVTEDPIGEGILLDLPEIADIGPLELTAPEVLRPFKPSEPPAPKPFKPSEPLVPGPFRPPEPILGPSRPSEEPIELVDFSNLD